MIQINITGADAAVTQTETLTAGRVGLECGFTFDSAWDGLSKIAVCEGADTRSVIMDSNTIIVPWECLADPGYKLRVGVRGENSKGDIVIPTVWARVGKIADSPGDDIDPGQEATPSVVQQIQETAANALYIARGVKAEADSGAFNGQDGADGAPGNPGVYIGENPPTDPDVSVWICPDGDPDPEIAEVTATIDDSTGTPSVDVELSGPPESRTIAFAFHNLKGATGATGAAGTQGATGPAGADGADGAPGQDGADGEDGYSPTVTVTSITGGHRVTITDADGDHVFDVMDGSGGGSSVTVDDELSDSSTNPVQNKIIKAALDQKGTYSKPSGGIPATDLASGVIPTVPTKVSDLTNDSAFVNASGAAAAAPVQSVNGYTGTVVIGVPAPATSGTPAMDGTAARGSSTDYAREDHVHPTDTSRAAASDLANKADKVTEVTVSTAGAVSQALDAGKMYHFTGALTGLTITLNAAASGQIAQYHFDFDMPATAFTPTVTGATLPDDLTWEASTHYEVDVLNGYGVVMGWTISS